ARRARARGAAAAAARLGATADDRAVTQFLEHSWRRLFHGAVRDSLANVGSLAERGSEDARGNALSTT
ncbi:MAG: hypothetical protein JWO86_5165, partial [Myxococcaceae bacterium]|nr:hypothetical protein [Myxococcaceae bacterium]